MRSRPALDALPSRLLLALLLVLVTGFSLVAPAVSHALVNAGGVQICTSSGMQVIPADDSPGTQSTDACVHCPFCLLTSDRLALPRRWLSHTFLVQAGQPGMAVRLAFFLPAPTYSKAIARAPPVWDETPAN